MRNSAAMIRSEMIHPTSDCFVRNCNFALREQIFDVSKAEREPEIEPDRLVNDLRREPISGVTDFRHALWLPSRRRRDNAAADNTSARFVGGGRRLPASGPISGESVSWKLRIPPALEQTGLAERLTRHADVARGLNQSLARLHHCAISALQTVKFARPLPIGLTPMPGAMVCARNEGRRRTASRTDARDCAWKRNSANA